MYSDFFLKLQNSLAPSESMISILLDTIETTQNKKENEIILTTYHKECVKFRELVRKEFTKPDGINAFDFFDGLKSIQEYITGCNESVVEPQSKGCFYATKDDRFSIKIAKKGKLFALQFQWFLLDVVNKGRTILKLKPLPKEYWTHRVPEQQLAKYVYFVLFLQRVLPKIETFLQFRQELFLQLKQLDSELEQNILTDSNKINDDLKVKLTALSEQIHSQKESLDQFSKKLLNDLREIYKDLYNKSGTVEFPTSKIQHVKLEKKTKQFLNEQEALFFTYNSNAFSFFEHWRFCYEIRFANLSILKHFTQKKIKLDSVFEKNLLDRDSRIIEELKAAYAKIKENQNLQDVQEKILSEQLLDQLLPEYLEILLTVDLYTPFNNLAKESTDEIKNIPKTFLLPSGSKWINGEKTHKLKETNVSEIINSSVNEFIVSSLSSLQEKLIQNIQVSTANTEELSGIIEYALEYYNSNESEDFNAQLLEFERGIERAVGKAEENKQYNVTVNEETLHLLDQINRTFFKEISFATSLEQLHKSQAEMLRKKRIQRFNELVKKGIDFSKKSALQSQNQTLNWFQKARQNYSSFREALGLSPNATSIDSALSNYLSETETAIARLPLMYQRLFRISPLENTKFRIDRPKVINKLEHAYSNWTNEKFAPTCLIGETGSGITSCVNVFVEKFGHQYPVHRFTLKQKIIGEAQFIAFLQTVFKDIDFKSLDELQDKIKSLKGKRIVILENIHQLFLRKRKGSVNLQLLFRLISQTNSKIFWFNTCLLYTYNYLNYTLEMNHYYEYIVILDRLSKEQISETIIKRHKFSGFKLQFNPPDGFSPKKSYKKMSETEKQDYLQEDYFKRLHNFAQNNLSLALIFWLRSVVSIEDNTFHLQFKQLNYSFFNSLNNAHITTLHALLLHGELSVEQHAAIFNWDKERSFAHLMVFTDDGILIQTNDRYSINPLVYRQVVNHLTVLNYIH